MVKYERVADILRQRLAHGDYALRLFPAERDVASELGVSYLTARKAVLQLISEGLLKRTDRGRAVPAANGGNEAPTVALLASGYPSRVYHRFHRLLEAAAERQGVVIHSLRFFHWNDQAVTDALTRSAGTLLIQPSEQLPAAVLAALREAPSRVVMAGIDLSHHGLHGIDHLPATGVRLALDHLVAQGHRRIVVLNLQPHDHAIQARLAEATAWARGHDERALVTVVDEPVPAGTELLASAREVAKRLLDTGDSRPSAVLGITLPAAMGALRAAADLGLAPGRDVAAIALDSEDYAMFLVPSVTTVDGSGLDTAVANALRWMTGGVWEGPAQMHCRLELNERESTALWRPA